MRRSGVDSWDSWVVAVACSVVFLLMAWPMRLAGQIFVSMLDHFQTNRKAASFAYALAYMMRSVSGPFAGYFGTRFGLQTVTIIGCALSSVGVGACFFAEDIVAVHLFLGLTYGFGFGWSTALIPEVINQHFDKHRAKAYGFAIGVSGLVAFVTPPLLDVILAHFGVSATFLIMSGILLNGVPAAMLLVKPRTTKKKSGINCSTYLDTGAENKSVSLAKNDCHFVYNQQTELELPLLVQKSKPVIKVFNPKSKPDFKSSNMEEFEQKQEMAESTDVSDNKATEELCKVPELSLSNHQTELELPLLTQESEPVISLYNSKSYSDSKLSNMKELEQKQEMVKITDNSGNRATEELCKVSEISVSNHQTELELPFMDQESEIVTNLSNSKYSSNTKSSNGKEFGQKQEMVVPTSGSDNRATKELCKVPVISVSNHQTELQLPLLAQESEPVIIMPNSDSKSIKMKELEKRQRLVEVTNVSDDRATEKLYEIVKQSEFPKVDKINHSVFSEVIKESNIVCDVDILNNKSKTKISANQTEVSNSNSGLLNVLWDPLFIIMTTIQSSHFYVMYLFFTVVVDFSRDKGALSHQEIYYVMALSLFDTVGRSMLGFVTDSGIMSKVNYCALCFGGMGLSCFLMIWMSGFPATMTATCLIGLLIGGNTTTLPGIVTEFFHKDKRPMAMASRLLMYAPMSFTMSPLIGYFREDLGSYDGLLCVLTVLCLACSSLVLLLPRISRC